MNDFHIYKNGEYVGSVRTESSILPRIGDKLKYKGVDLLIDDLVIELGADVTFGEGLGKPVTVVTLYCVEK